mmetsp:Transcript_65587/g.166198  ORF Transcript_65587/g.166198 Transcript_65587/m.166198 type:complete len:232 (+) Transcript_65587:827-1522(+)
MHLQLRREMQLLLLELVLLHLALVLLLLLELRRHLLLVLPLHLELVLLVLLLLLLLLLLHHLKLLLVMLSLLVMQLLLMVGRGRCRRMRQGCAARRSRGLFLDNGGLAVRPHQLVPALLDVLREVPDAAGEVLDGTLSALVPRAGVILVLALGGFLPHHRRLRGAVDERVHVAPHRGRGPPAVAVTVAKCRIGSSRDCSWDAGHKGGGQPSRPDSSNNNAGTALQRRRGAI